MNRRADGPMATSSSIRLLAGHNNNSSYRFKNQLRVYLWCGETSDAFVQLVKLELDLMMPLDASFGRQG